MPTYDYRCPLCDNIEEHIHRIYSIQESPEIFCTKCMEGEPNVTIPPMKMIISPSKHGLMFKGSGWCMKPGATH